VLQEAHYSSPSLREPLASDHLGRKSLIQRLFRKLFDEIGRKIRFFPSIEDCVYWYNTIKPHGALNLKTPIEAYYGRMPQLDMLVDPSILEGGIILDAKSFLDTTHLGRKQFPYRCRPVACSNFP